MPPREPLRVPLVPVELRERLRDAVAEVLPLLHLEERTYQLDEPLSSSAPHPGAQLTCVLADHGVRSRLGAVGAGTPRLPGVAEDLHDDVLRLAEAFDRVRAYVENGDVVAAVESLSGVRVQTRETLRELWALVASLVVDLAETRGRLARAIAARDEAHATLRRARRQGEAPLESELLAAIEAALVRVLPPEPEWTSAQWDLVLAVRDARCRRGV